jgi:regulator of protease activity HflC (stomatin/prohibitin superfamily)
MVMFQWLSDIITALLEFVPRRVIIRSTHAGVKWRIRGGPVEMKPGWRIWWPLISDIEVIPVARQTLNTETQALMTKDCKQVVVGGVVVYSINDIVKAIGKQNYDVDDTVNDISQATIVEVITAWNMNDLLEEISGEVEKQLTESCRRQMRQYGVYIHRAALTDFSTCKTANLLGVNVSMGE